MKHDVNLLKQQNKNIYIKTGFRSVFYFGMKIANIIKHNEKYFSKRTEDN